MAWQSVHPRLLVDDYTVCFRFYRDVLGLTVAFGDETSGYADFAAGGSEFSLFARQEMLEALGTVDDAVDDRTQFVLVFGVDDVDRVVAEVTGRGGAVAIPATDHPDWGIRTAHVRDPERNLLEINAPLQP